MVTAKEKSKEIAIAKLEEYVLNREAVKSLKHSLERLAASGRPSKLSAVSYNISSSGGYRPDMINIYVEWQRITELIAEKRSEMLVIEDALAMISKGYGCECYSDILIMRHMDGYSMERIAEKLKYSSRQTVYNQYNKALVKFIKALGI